jgi:hypothetical protein
MAIEGMRPMHALDWLLVSEVQRKKHLNNYRTNGHRRHARVHAPLNANRQTRLICKEQMKHTAAGL